MKLTMDALIGLLGTNVKAGPLRVLAKTRQLPASEKMKVVRILKEANDHIAAFEEVRNGLIEKYGEAGSVKETSPKFKEFLAELTPVLDEEVEIKSPAAKLVADTVYEDLDSEMLLALGELVVVK